MKVIDLLNKIANGEDIPKKIQYSGYIYERLERFDNKYSYKNCNGCYIEDDFYLINILNNEVKIIEDTPKEDKKIERLDETKANEDIFTYSTSGSNLYFLSLYVKSTIVDKINEIIDKVNGEDHE